MKKIWLPLVFFFGLGFQQLHAQEYLDLILNPNEGTTLQEIQTLAETYFADRDKGRGSGYKQYKRWEYKMERMVNSDGKLLNFSKLTWDAIAYTRAESSPIGRSSGTWTPLGPTAYTNGPGGYNGGLGRVNVIAFHPTNANTIYIGVPAGGVWKTTNGGSTWTPMADMLASIGVSGIAVDHSNPNTVYILTGDGDGGDTQSIGVMKSTDGGTTWNTTGLTWGVTNFNRGYKLLMHPTNANIMFAATTVGILKTTDGWNTWSTVQSGNFRDIEFKPGTPSTMYATTTNTFYRSVDTGTSWGVVSTGLPGGENRAAIAVTPANANYVYYLAGPGGSSGSSTFNGLYRSTDSGVSFSTRSTTPNILGHSINGTDSSDQSWYDLAIAVDPNNANTTITGGINIWRSTNGGTSHSLIAHWFQPNGTPYVHADIHELVFNPINNALYCGSDGGISVSTNGGVTWTNIWNGLQIMQFYRIAGVEANQNLIVGGSQDNGSNKYTGSPTIQHILGGDGMDCMIDYNNNNTMYYGFQFGGLQRSFDGGSTATGIQPGGSTGAWVTPYAMDASNPNIIYGGYSDVYRSTNQGNTWTNLGSDGRGALAVGINDPARLYAAVGSTLQTSANTGGSWTTITGPWSTLTVTFIAVDPANANRVWVTVGGYNSTLKVFESMNAGASWTNISSGLPNTPALSIVYENTGGSPMDAIYVGTGIGVFYRSDVTPWTLCGTGLPNVPVFDLEINHTNNKIRAGTYGRGLWEAPLFGGAACNIQISNVTTSPPSCPGENDGTLTVTASCPTCVNISYTITPTSPPGPAINQVGNGVFTNLAANSYDVQIEDSNNAACATTWPSNPVVLTDGTDSNPPAIGCPPNVSIQCGDDTSPNNTGFATASDTCDPSPSLTFSDSSVSGCGNTEVITRTWTATDASGNTASCVQTITVIDTVPPTPTCPNDIATNNDPGACGAIVNYTAPTGTDACGGVTVSQTGGLASGAMFPVGTTTNTFEITDDCGNTVTCTFDVVVSDTEDPMLTCPADQTVDIAGGPPYTVPDYFANGMATVSDNCTNPVTNTTQNPTPGTQLPVGVYTVTLTAEDSNANSTSCTFQLTVDDTLGVEDREGLETILLYPNPATHSVSLSNPQSINLNALSIYDISGRRIQTINLVNMGTEKTLDITQLASSIYLVVIRSEFGQVVKQLVKE